jgi:hypothetical protein
MAQVSSTYGAFEFGTGITYFVIDVIFKIFIVPAIKRGPT